MKRSTRVTQEVIVAQSSGLEVKSTVKAGGLSAQHNRQASRALRIKSNVRAGGAGMQHNRPILASPQPAGFVRVFAE